MSTDLTTNDTRFIQSYAHKTITLDSGSSGVISATFSSGSNNISSPTTASSYYTSLNHLFYKLQGNNNRGIYYSNTEYITNPQHKNKFYDNGLVISISGSRYGYTVKPGTFQYTDTTNTISYILKDDGYGNLYSVDPQLSQSGDTSISSSDNYVGNIFYEHGIAVITETSSYNSTGGGQFYVSGGTNYSMSFDSTVIINTMEYTCRFLPHQYNWSTNPTILSSSFGESISTHSFFDSNMTSNEALYGRKGYPIVHEESRSIWWVNDPSINKKYLTRDFMPYISKIGLRNKYNDLIMIASFEKPIQKRNDETMTIKVQMDF